MSFLANLRQNQQPATPVGLQLCYLWRRQGDGRVLLSLFLGNIERGRLRELGKPYTLQREHLQLPPPFMDSNDVKVLRLLLSASQQWLNKHCLECFPDDIQGFLSLVVSTQKSFFEHFNGAWEPLVLNGSYSSEPEWTIGSDGAQSLNWRMPTDHCLWMIGDNPYCFDTKGTCLKPVDMGNVKSLAKRVVEQPPVEAAALNDFIKCAGEQWEASGLPLPKAIPIEDIDGVVEPVIYLFGESLAFGVRYTSELLCTQRLYTEPAEEQSVWNGLRLLRMTPQSKVESQCLERLEPFVEGFFCEKNGLWSPGCSEQWKQFLLKDRLELEALGFAFQFERSFKHYYILPKNWSVDVTRKEDDQWGFNVSVDVDEQTVDVCELLKQLHLFNQSVQDSQQEVRIGGKILVLSSELVGSLTAELGDLLEFSNTDGPIPLSQLYRLKKLKDRLPESTQWCGETQLLEQSIDLHSSPIMLDSQCSGVKADLRPYQWLGVCWIQHLKQSGFNGLLADDMGLGKTLQTLAHLSLEQQNKLGARDGKVSDAPALIIAPTSLMSNWAAEINKFCPHLSFVVLHGSQRHEKWGDINGKDIVITSYPLIVRDQERWQQQAISWLILDEAQVIKNVGTKVSQAVRGLVSEHRLCLSGTPVENHLGELWSILDFLEPGVLGSQKQFRSYYQKNIENDACEQRFSQLLSRIEPFILRRTKTQVAKDLPPKTVIKKMVTLGEEQMGFYEDLKTADWEALSEQLLDTENKGKKQILLLSALMRLRQACCDPLLLENKQLDNKVLSDDTAFSGRVPSAKTEFCMDMLSELVDEGRAVLVFSQFTSMLDILAERLESSKMDYLMLTGKSKNRAELVEQFQSGKAPVFLISLKAGGVGLNLTRADTVIHFDPWWNQAAEEQASDRAHRIGQKNPVFVYKLIAEGTIEEKIALMQERKSILSQQVNKQAQLSGETFALKLEDLLTLLDS